MPTSRTTRARTSAASTAPAPTAPTTTTAGARARTERHSARVVATALVVALAACAPTSDDATDDRTPVDAPPTASGDLAIDPTAGSDTTAVEQQPARTGGTTTPGAPIDGGSDATDGGVDAAVDQETTEAAVDLVGEVPQDFPDDIPLPADADVLSGTSLADGDRAGFSLALQPAGSIEDVAADLVAGFQASGYTVDDLGQVTSGEAVSHPLRFDGPDWTGTVVIGDNADGTIAVYTVAAVPG